jgi:hypothetical protein
LIRSSNERTGVDVSFVLGSSSCESDSSPVVNVDCCALSFSSTEFESDEIPFTEGG